MRRDEKYSDFVSRVLSESLNPILAKGVFKFALGRQKITVEQLNKNGITKKFIDHVIFATGVMACGDTDKDELERKLKAALLSAAVPERPQQKPQKDSIEIRIIDELDIVRARTAARDFADSIGFRFTDQTRIATAVSELSRNIYSYAKTGTISLSRIETATKKGIGIIATDDGPGIPNVERILKGDYVSRTGMGCGLVGCKRLMDNFHVQTAAGRGTRVSLEKYL